MAATMATERKGRVLRRLHILGAVFLVSCTVPLLLNQSLRTSTSPGATMMSGQTSKHQHQTSLESRDFETRRTLQQGDESKLSTFSLFTKDRASQVRNRAKSLQSFIQLHDISNDKSYETDMPLETRLFHNHTAAVSALTEVASDIDGTGNFSLITPPTSDDLVRTIRTVRMQLEENRKISEMGTLRAYSRPHLPRNLTILGKAIYRVVPRSFLPEYRSPCFALPPDDDQEMACLPSVFLAGFPKCATTDVFKKMMGHPDIVTTSKEPHWWTRTHFTETSVLHYLDRQRGLVKRLLETRNNRLITVDASASTLWDSTYSLGKFGSIHTPPHWTHADVLRAVLPDSRFVVLLRDPIQRIYSAYMAFDSEWRNAKSPQDFHVRLLEALRDFRLCLDRFSLKTCANLKNKLRLNVGMYSIFIREWLQRFPRDQIHVIRTEDWSRDPVTHLKDIYRFLRLDPLTRAQLENVTSSSRENRRRSEDTRLGGMLPASRRLLELFYSPFNEDLAVLLTNRKYLWGDSFEPSN